jgi:hypothetical protein
MLSRRRRTKRTQPSHRFTIEGLEQRVLLAANGLAGVYYNNTGLTGSPVAARVDPAVNFTWSGAPAAGVGADNFSVRWSGQLLPRYSGAYSFITTSDDGIRLFINGQKVIDNWTRHAAATNVGGATLTAGVKVDIRVEFFEASGGATAQLSWYSRNQQHQEIIPTSQLFAAALPVINPTPPPNPTAPAVPGSFAASALSSSQIKLSWQDVANETGYKLERSSDGSTNWTQIATPGANATNYTDSNLSPSTKYFYRLRASNSAGDSGYTAVASATTQAVVTPPPATGSYQPDQIIQIHHDTTFVGDNIYNATGLGQTKDGVAGFYTTIFKIRVYNDGKTADSFIITGPKGDANWRIEYYDSFAFGWNGGKNITADVTGNGWNTGNVDPGAYREYRVELLPYAAPGGDVRAMTWTARSTHDATKVDVVKGTITNPIVRQVAWRRQNFDQGGTYLMTIENQGNLPDQFNVTAALGAGNYSVQFFDDQWGGNDVTAAVRSATGWKTKVLQPYQSQEFRVVFSNFTDAKVPSVNLTTASVANSGSKEQLTVNIPPAQKAVGTPTGAFPIGVWTQPMSSFDKWKSRGVNTLIEYQGDGATIEQWSQAARDRGMFYVRRPLANPALDVGDKNLLAWALPDEPEITSKYPAATLKTWIDGWKQADPNRPIWVNFSGGYVLHWQGNVFASGYQPYTDLVDWTSSSIYPVTGWNRPTEHPGLDAPGEALDRLEKWTDGKPQWAVLESGDQELSWIQKEIGGPTPGQFRAEVWDSIIHGARGVIYFPESFSPSFKFDNTPPEIAAEMAATNAKIQSIASVLLGDIDPATRGLQVDGPLEGTWRVQNGKTYFVVLNFSNQAVTKNVTLQGIGSASSASVVGENRAVSLTNGAFSDTFAPYSVHVYQV